MFFIMLKISFQTMFFTIYRLNNHHRGIKVPNIINQLGKILRIIGARHIVRILLR